MFDPYRSLAWIVREHHGYVKKNAPFSELKWANFFHTHVLLDQDILAGKHTYDDFAFDVDEKGVLEATDDGKEILEEALFLATSPDARRLPSFRGPASKETRMAMTNEKSAGFRIPVLEGILPIKASQIPLELIAGLTLAGARHSRGDGLHQDFRHASHHRSLHHPDPHGAVRPVRLLATPRGRCRLGNGSNSRRRTGGAGSYRLR